MWLFPTRQSCQEFNTEMLSWLKAVAKDIPCINEVDETTGKFKWTQEVNECRLQPDGWPRGLSTDCSRSTCHAQSVQSFPLKHITLPSSMTDYKHLAISSG